MPIRPPILDDRRYEDLVAELVARIPAHTPEWTYPQPGDPGRTLIELFAWLGDALLYRVNLIPERQRLAFLRLLGEPLRPARPASGLVTMFSRESPVDAPLALAVPARFTGPGELPFESRGNLMVLPVTASGWVKRPAEIDHTLATALATFHRGQLPEPTGLGGSPAVIAPYAAEPLFADGQPEVGGFDVVTQTTDRCLWLALLAARDGDPTTDDGAALQRTRNDGVRRILGGEVTAGSALLNVGFVPALPAGEPLEPAAARARVPHVWEITANLTGQTPDAASPWTPQYLRLDEFADTTAGLTRPGVLRLALPATNLIHAPTNDVREDPSAGVGDRPPRLDDEAVAARLVAWIRLRPVPSRASTSASAQAGVSTAATAAEFATPATTGTPSNTPNVEVAHLPVQWIGINAVEVEQLTTTENVLLGQSAQLPDQEFALQTGSIEPETLQIEVEEGGSWRAWRRVDDLLTFADNPAELRDAPVFTLDAEAGVLRFGDDVRGRIPPQSARIRARRFRAGGGAAGNLPAGSLTAVTAKTLQNVDVSAQLLVFQPLPFTGGADAESLAQAEKRLPARLRHRERAVTAEDYQTLARQTPGVAVGRVELLPRFKPQQRFFNIAGVVSVLALPDRPLAPPPNPRADRTFLETIHAWLDARRPLGTELYVIGCEYVAVSISVGVTIREGNDPETTLQTVRDALRRVLWPLTGGGFDGRGWALGRALSNRELAVEVARVSGVSEVAGLNLFTQRAGVGGAAPTWNRVGDPASGAEQRISLEPYQLPELLHIHAVADDTLSGAPLNLGVDDRNPYAAPNAVGVPVVPKLC